MGDNFDYYVSQSLYYPEDEILYLYYTQALTNYIYIGNGNDINIIYNFGEDGERTIETTKAIEGSQSFLLQMSNEEYNKLKNISLQVFDIDTQTLLFGSIEFEENIIEYEDLSNYNITPKSNIEKQKEINYFKYLYKNDPLWANDKINEVGGIDSAFIANTKSNHQFLVEVLNSVSYTESKNDEVMNYFESVMDNELYKDYFKATSKSEKLAIYNSTINEMIGRLNNGYVISTHSEKHDLN